jgi:hypothetical protein
MEHLFVLVTKRLLSRLVDSVTLLRAEVTRIKTLSGRKFVES